MALGGDMAIDGPGGGGLLDPEGALERLAAWKGRIDHMAASTEAMRDRLQALRVTLADPNGLVEVTIDSTGALVDLHLSQRIQRVAPDLVARTIMETVAAAKARAAARAQEIVTETMGASSTAGAAIAEQVGQRLAGPEPDADPYSGRGSDRDDSAGYRGEW